MKRCLLVLGAAGIVVVAAARDGLAPRASVADYPAKAEAGPAAVGAALLSPDQVRKSFSTDLNSGYIVVEAGVFPKAGARVDLGPGDFMLREAGTSNTYRPVGPKAIAGVLQKRSSKDRDITLYPTVGVGYETGPDYGPYGGRRGGGWNTGVGVGVGVGGSQQPASTDADRRTMETELSEQQIPEKVITAPAAGYLYFPVPPKARTGAWELEYNSPAGKTVVPLVTPPDSKPKKK